MAPILFGSGFHVLKDSPLNQFQTTKFDRDDVYQLLQSINRSIEGEPLQVDVLKHSFELNWSKLEERVGNSLSSSPAPKNSDLSPGVEELLELGREQARRLNKLETAISKLRPSDTISSEKASVRALNGSLSEIMAEFREKVSAVDGLLDRVSPGPVVSEIQLVLQSLDAAFRRGGEVLDAAATGVASESDLASAQRDMRVLISRMRRGA